MGDAILFESRNRTESNDEDVRLSENDSERTFEMLLVMNGTLRGMRYGSAVPPPPSLNKLISIYALFPPVNVTLRRISRKKGDLLLLLYPPISPINVKKESDCTLLWKLSEEY